MPEVGIIVGSDSDLPKITQCFTILEEFNISFEIIVSSAHRTPGATQEWAKGAISKGIKVIIAAAGGAAHLPGVVASHTTLPVIGIPIETGIAGGIDSIFSILQMPSGIPVAAMPVGKSGGVNAALFAISILALNNQNYKGAIENYRKRWAVDIADKNERLKSSGFSEYINKMNKE